MKKLFVFLVIWANILNGQNAGKGSIMELSAGYKMGVPTGNLGNYIRNGHGIVFQGMFKPSQKLPLWIGGNLDFLIYGTTSTPQEYVFPDGSVANVDVNVTSSITSYQLATKYHFPISSLFQPYAMLRMGGSTFSTLLYIEDPRYQDECVALEQEHLHKSHTFNLTPALGSRIYFNEQKFLFLDFNVGYTYGGEISFMNPTLGENMNQSPNHNQHSYNTAINGEAAQPYYVNFLNRRTQVVHKHHVGNIYESTFNMLQLRLAIGITF